MASEKKTFLWKWKLKREQNYSNESEAAHWLRASYIPLNDYWIFLLNKAPATTSQQCLRYTSPRTN